MKPLKLINFDGLAELFKKKKLFKILFDREPSGFNHVIPGITI